MRHITTIRKSLLACGRLTLLLSIGACGPAINEVRVETGSTPLKPVFFLTDTTGHASTGTIYGLSVVPCGEENAVWQIAANGSAASPSRLEYGVTPPGYVVHIGPAPLRAGCYDVFVTDGRRSRFRVDASGHVTTSVRRDSTAR